MPIETLQATNARMITLSALVISLAMVGMAFVSLRIGRSITRPLSALTTALGDLSEGQLEIEVPGVGRGDEIGAIARATDVLRRGALDAEVQRSQRQEDREAAFKRQVAMLETMAHAVKAESQNAVDTVHEDARALIGNSNRLTKAARVIGDNTIAVSAAAQQSQASTVTLADATNMLEGTISGMRQEFARMADTTRKAVGLWGCGAGGGRTGNSGISRS